MSVPFTTSHVHAPAANTAAVITLAAPGAGRCHVISRIDYSYSATPTGGGLTITNGGNTVFSINIAAGGPGSITFNPYRQGSPNAAVVVTLAAGSGTVAGKLNVTTWVV